MMRTRLEQLEYRLGRNTVKFDGYNGENDDVYTWLKHSDDVKHEVIFYKVGCNERARLLEASKFPVFNASKMIKTTPS